MPGIKVQLSGVSFSDTSLPVLRDDPILPTAGAMMLMEPAHQVTPWAAGVPANGTYLPNIAASQFAAMVGSSTDADVKPRMIVPPTFVPTVGKLERTGKGGIHCALVQGGTTGVAQSGPAITLPVRMLKWILDNPLHLYYMAVWFRNTRNATTDNTDYIVAINGNGQQTNSYLFNLTVAGNPASAKGVRPTAGDPPRNGLRDAVSGSGLGNHFVDAAASGYWTSATPNRALPGDGQNTSVTGTLLGGALGWGAQTPSPGIGATGSTGDALPNPNGSPVGSSKDKHGSHAIYRFYLEDLTVSGRSYATVDAIEYQLYQDAVVASTGRYNGDTFTDPTTYTGS